MPDDIFIDVVVKNSNDQEVGRAAVSAPGFHEFFDLPTDTYTVSFTPPKDLELATPSPQIFQLTGYKNSLKIFADVRTKSIVNGVRAQVTPVEYPPPKPPWTGIILASIGLFAAGNFQSCQKSLSSANYRGRPQATYARPSIRQYRMSRFSPEVEAGLRECLRENYESIATDLLNIPSFSVTNIISSTIEDNLQEEAITQIIQSRDALLQLRDTFESCDPSLVLEITSTRNDTAVSTMKDSSFHHEQIQNTVTIVGKDVNVREFPSLDSKVIAQISNTFVLIDTEAFISLTDFQRNEILSGSGWQPIILSDGRRGYVHSSYISREIYESP